MGLGDSSMGGNSCCVLGAEFDSSAPRRKSQAGCNCSIEEQRQVDPESLLASQLRLNWISGSVRDLVSRQ
jgi:hypothetical protein